MNKKVYITPAVVTFQMAIKDGILFSASDGEKGILGDGGGTSGKVSKGDTKDQGDYDVWDE